MPRQRAENSIEYLAVVAEDMFDSYEPYVVVWLGKRTPPFSVSIYDGTRPKYKKIRRTEAKRFAADLAEVINEHMNLSKY